MKSTATDLPGVMILEPEVHGDERGFFFEAWNQQRFLGAGIEQEFVQLNFSRSSRGVLRGLHYQNPNPQAKLVTVLEGEVFDVAVDIRRGSPTFAHWFGCTLSAQNRKQLYIPEGFAHGFCTLSETALFSYMVSDFYAPDSDWAVAWNDPEIGIDWPAAEFRHSPRDAGAPDLDQTPEDRLPRYQPELQ